MTLSGARKIVLVSSQPYSAEHDELLLSFIRRPIDLFCATGVDCDAWETAMDLMLTNPDHQFKHHITTTSHCDEPLADVIFIAEHWFVDGDNRVEVVEV